MNNVKERGEIPRRFVGPSWWHFSPFPDPTLLGEKMVRLTFEPGKKLLLLLRSRIRRVALRRLLIFMLSILGALLLIFSSCTIVEEEEEGGGEGRIQYFDDKSLGSDAEKIVDDIWESKVIPTILEQAVDLRLVMDELPKDREAAGQKYGHREKGGVYDWNFIVKGEGRIVDIKKRAVGQGTLAIDLPPYDDKPDVPILIGPVIRSLAIRDALEFITFTDGVEGSSGIKYMFKHQVPFAHLSNELNNRGNRDVLAALEPEMCVKLTDSFFTQVKREGESNPNKKIPDKVLDTLKSLADRPCPPEESFWEAVKNQVGEEAEQYKGLILKYADMSDMGKRRQIRFYGAMTDDRPNPIKIEVIPVQLEFVEEGQS
jgi:predicted lipoprotein